MPRAGPLHRLLPVGYNIFALPRIIIGIFTLGIALALAQAPPADTGYLLRGGTVHTISGPVIENGSVLVHNSKIIGVGKDLSAPEGFKVLDIHGQHVYPGMIDGASMIGRDLLARQIHGADGAKLGVEQGRL